MSGRRTNLALGMLVPAAVVTGFLGFAIGTPTIGTGIVVVHGAIGLAIALVSPWKSAVARRGLRRRRSGRWPSVILAALIAVIFVTGLAHAAGVRVVGAGITAMQVHVGAALFGIALLGWHVWVRPVRPQRQDLSRRSLLRAGVLAAAAGASWGATEAAVSLAGTQGAMRRFTGSHEVGSFAPEQMPVTQWLFDAIPTIPAAEWRLRLLRADGAVILGMSDLEVGDRVRAAIDCTGGWWSTQDWSGVRLDRLMGPPGSAASVVVTSATGYRRRFGVADLPSLWLATSCAGSPLSAGHGAPARLVAPGRRGFWWVKWVTAIELDDVPAWRQPPFPLQ